MTAVLIDASNIRTGGGIQVVGSFLDEVAKMVLDGSPLLGMDWFDRCRVEVSSAVAADLGNEAARALNVSIRDVGWNDMAIWRPRPPEFDVSFTVFGPAYGWPRARTQIVGCADGTVMFPRPPGIQRPALMPSAKGWMRRSVSRALFTRADHMVVETAELKTRISEVLKVLPERITVVPNTINGVFAAVPVLDRSRRRPSCRLWAYAARAYPHKNLDFLGELGEVLARKHGHDIRFAVTLREDEWRDRSRKFREHTVNVGPLNVSALPGFYSRCEAAIFPSLLETYSAMPLEALRMGLPLFASEREFVRTICADAATYFDPLDAEAAGDVIAAALRDEAALRRKVLRGYEIVDALPTARDRAIAYLELIDGFLSNSGSASSR